MPLAGGDLSVQGGHLVVERHYCGQLKIKGLLQTTVNLRIKVLKILPQPLQRLTPMTHLLFFRRTHLSKGALIARYPENWVIAKTVLTTGRC